MEQQVVFTNSELVGFSAWETVEAVAGLEAALLALDANPATGEMAAALDALSTAITTYHQMEAAVFYIDTANPAEMESLPDPNGSSLFPPQPTSLDGISDSLAGYKRSLEQNGGALGEKNQMPLEAALAETRDFRARLVEFARAWERDDPENFRNRFFLSSTDEGLAKILQGTITLGESLILERWLLDKNRWDETNPPPLDAISGALSGLHNNFWGSYSTEGGTLLQGPGLFDLVRAKWPHGAEDIGLAISSSMSTVAEIGHSLDPEEGRSLLIPVLEQITLDLITASAILGLEVVETGGPENPRDAENLER